MLFRFKVGCVGLCLVFPAEMDFCPMNTRELPRRLYITNSLFAVLILLIILLATLKVLFAQYNSIYHLVRFVASLS